MKVALIGNMNNNNFVFLRFLRDSGINAYLLLFKNELNHFLPECDTFFIEKWKPYIKQLSFENGGLSFIKTKREIIKKELKGYDVYIAHGLAPAYFYKIKKRLDFVIPYSIGIEYVIEYKYLNLSSLRDIRRTIYRNYVIHYQKLGLKKAKQIITADDSFETKLTLKKLKKTPIPLPIPVVYSENTQINIPLKLLEYIRQIKNYDFIAFSHVSQIWKDIEIRDEIPNIFLCKKNNIAIEGFSEFINRTKSNSALILFEYGVDASESKKLITKLGIENNVLWLPKMQRKEIMILLKYADIGISELGGILWGGTGWEFIALGIPFIHYLDMTSEEFMTNYEFPMPEFYNCQTKSEIVETLINAYSNQKNNAIMGEKNIIWYRKYIINDTINKYISLINDAYKNNINT